MYLISYHILVHTYFLGLYRQTIENACVACYQIHKILAILFDIMQVINCSQNVEGRLYNFMGQAKEYVDRRHNEAIKFLFLPEMGLLGSQASTEKKSHYEL